jgi:hypothetical protein
MICKTMEELIRWWVYIHKWYTIESIKEVVDISIVGDQLQFTIQAYTDHAWSKQHSVNHHEIMLKYINARLGTAPQPPVKPESKTTTW